MVISSCATYPASYWWCRNNINTDILTLILRLEIFYTPIGFMLNIHIFSRVLLLTSHRFRSCRFRHSPTEIHWTNSKKIKTTFHVWKTSSWIPSYFCSFASTTIKSHFLHSSLSLGVLQDQFPISNLSFRHYSLAYSHQSTVVFSAVGRCFV